MKARVLCMAIGFLCIASTANAGRFSGTEYECSQMDKERDGIECKVSYADPTGRLLIRIHRKIDDPKEQRDRTSYVIKTTMHNFMASGGIFMSMQTNRKSDGRLVERHCSKAKRGTKEVCGDWNPV